MSDDALERLKNRERPRVKSRTTDLPDVAAESAPAPGEAKTLTDFEALQQMLTQGETLVQQIQGLQTDLSQQLAIAQETLSTLTRVSQTAQGEIDLQQRWTEDLAACRQELQTQQAASQAAIAQDLAAALEVGNQQAALTNKLSELQASLTLLREAIAELPTLQRQVQALEARPQPEALPVPEVPVPEPVAPTDNPETTSQLAALETTLATLQQRQQIRFWLVTSLALGALLLSLTDYLPLN